MLLFAFFGAKRRFRSPGGGWSTQLIWFVPFTGPYSQFAVFISVFTLRFAGCLWCRDALSHMHGSCSEPCTRLLLSTLDARLGSCLKSFHCNFSATNTASLHAPSPPSDAAPTRQNFQWGSSVNHAEVHPCCLIRLCRQAGLLSGLNFLRLVPPHVYYWNVLILIYVIKDAENKATFWSYAICKRNKV